MKKGIPNGAKFPAVIALASLGLISCSTASGGQAAPKAASTVHTAKPTASQPTASPTVSGPADHLAGFGATRAGFASAHIADPDPKLVPGCCFGPKITNRGSSSPMDQYGPVLYGGAYVVNEDLNFDTDTPQSLAEAVADRELPHDAQVVRQKAAPECFTVLYRSHLLQRETRGLGSFIAVSYYGPFNSNYDSHDVEEAIISSSLATIGQC